MPSKKTFGSAVANSNVTAYSLDHLKQILKYNENEFRLLSKVRHENIITLFGVTYDQSGDTLPLLVMEGVHCDLYNYYLNNSEFISWDEDLMILQGISSGLVYLHEGENIVHNNISTRSILLTKNLIVKLSSFEYAVQLPKKDTKTRLYSSDILSLGSVISVIQSLKHTDTYGTNKESSKQLMTSLFEMCTNGQLTADISSYDILKTLKDHKR